MKVISRTQLGIERDAEYHIYPLGCLHIGAAGTNEKLLQRTIQAIADDPYAYWIGMGDYGNFINRTDKRFDPSELASWFSVRDLSDIAGATANRVISLLSPIASKCLGMVEGNHEQSIEKKYERDIYSDIVNAIKKEGGFAGNDELAFGYSGYLRLKYFYRQDKQDGKQFTLSLHHGFGGGGRFGGKANAIETWLWTHDCDLAIFAHVHTFGAVPAAVEYVDKGGHIRVRNKFGVYSGTYLIDKVDGVDGYEVKKGCLPLPYGGCVIHLRPYDEYKPIRIMVG